MTLMVYAPETSQYLKSKELVAECVPVTGISCNIFVHGATDETTKDMANFGWSLADWINNKNVPGHGYTNDEVTQKWWKDFLGLGNSYVYETGTL